MMLLFNFISVLCEVLVFTIIIRVLLSWVFPNPYNPFVRILYEITEPILAPLRRIIPRIGMLDITPFIAIIILQAIASLLP
jgi:YggT family protein